MNKFICYPRIKPKVNEKGQNLVELALILPLILVILIGVLDLGRIFFAQIAVANAAREGVRYLTTHPADGLGNTFIKTKEAASDQASFSGLNLDSSKFTVVAECDIHDEEGCEAGRKLNSADNRAVVTVTYMFEPIFGWILPNEITLSETAIMVVP